MDLRLSIVGLRNMTELDHNYKLQVRLTDHSGSVKQDGSYDVHNGFVEDKSKNDHQEIKMDDP